MSTADDSNRPVSAADYAKGLAELREILRTELERIETAAQALQLQAETVARELQAENQARAQNENEEHRVARDKHILDERKLQATRFRASLAVELLAGHLSQRKDLDLSQVNMIPEWCPENGTTEVVNAFKLADLILKVGRQS